MKAVEDSNSRALFDEGTQLAAPSNGFPLVDTSLVPQQTIQPQFTANPFWQQQQLAAQQQAEYEWMLQQQQLAAAQQQQAQLAAQQQAQQEEWMRQQLLLQQQQQQQQQAYLQQQQQQANLFAASPIQAQPTGFGSNNPFALNTGSQFSSPPPPVPNFASSPSPAFGSQQQQQQQLPQFQQSTQPTTQSAFASASSPSPRPPPSPTTANTLANARRPGVIDEAKHAELNSLFANRSVIVIPVPWFHSLTSLHSSDDGQDTFGNVGNLRFGHTYTGQLATQQTGHNPFAKKPPQSNDQPFFSI